MQEIDIVRELITEIQKAQSIETVAVLRKILIKVMGGKSEKYKIIGNFHLGNRDVGFAANRKTTAFYKRLLSYKCWTVAIRNFLISE